MKDEIKELGKQESRKRHCFLPSCLPYSSLIVPPSSLRQYPRQESNLIPDLRKVVCDPPHPEDVNQKSEVGSQLLLPLVSVV